MRFKRLWLPCAAIFLVGSATAGLRTGTSLLGHAGGLAGVSPGLADVASVTLPAAVLDFTAAQGVGTDPGPGAVNGERVLTVTDQSVSGATITGGGGENAPRYSSTGPKFYTDSATSAQVLSATGVDSFSTGAFTLFMTAKKTGAGSAGFEFRQYLSTLVYGQNGAYLLLMSANDQIQAVGYGDWATGLPTPVTETVVTMIGDTSKSVLPFSGLMIEANGSSSFRRQDQNSTALPAETVSAITFGGVSAGGQYPFVGEVKNVTLYDEVLTSAQRTAKRASLGGGSSTATEQLVFIGDSLTVGYLGQGNFTGYTDQVIAGRIALGERVRAWNLGITGRTTTTMLAELDDFVGLYDSSLARNIAILWAGTNNAAMATGDHTGTYADLVTLGTALRTAGFYVIVIDCLPKGSNADFETARIALNSAIAAGYTTWADALVAIGSDATIGVAGSQNNSTNYQGDKTHLTSAGYVPLNTAVAAAIASVP